MAVCIFFFFNDTATTEIYTLSLHDALPISSKLTEDGERLLDYARRIVKLNVETIAAFSDELTGRDRKSTRLNSSHDQISYAVFCLKKKTTIDAKTAMTQNSTVLQLTVTVQR